MASKKDMRRPDLGKSSLQMGDAKSSCASMFDLANYLFAYSHPVWYDGLPGGLKRAPDADRDPQLSLRKRRARATSLVR